MVLAEVPLWVVHSLSAQSTNTLIPTATTNVKSSSQSEATKSKIKETSSISETIKVLSGTAARCAIYSVDIHPDGSRFATAGGDGRVRIWACDSVFCDKFDEKKRAVFEKGGEYDSSSSSSAGGSIDCGIMEEKHKENNGMKNETKELVFEKEIGNPLEKKDENKAADKQQISPMSSSLPKIENKKRRIVLEKLPPSSISINKNLSTSVMSPKFKTKHRLLSSLSSHTGSVLCVRWSHSGTYLASSGDDAHILLYKRSTSHQHSILQTGNLLPSAKEEQVEHWTRIRTLRGHNLDAVGIAWAPDDSYLVSCSLDSENPVIVWKLNLMEFEGTKMQQKQHYQPILHPFMVLGRDAHKSTVKGVVFDPAGKYIATSGDDPAICIWRAWDDWGLEARIDSESGIFRSMRSEAVTDLSLFRRMSFAPDGTHLCSTNAVLKGKNIAAMVTRNGWSVKNSGEGGVSLVGHKQPVVSSRHCPYFMNHTNRNKDDVNEDDEDVEPNYAMLLALGDKMGFVTVWSTKSKRPIFKLQCSETRCTITDLSWGRNPKRDLLWLYVSMLDGHVVTLQFKVNDDVGSFLSNDKHARIFRLKYGIQMEEDGTKMKGIVCGKGTKLIENALQFTFDDSDPDIEDDSNNVEFKEREKTKPQQTLAIKLGKKRIRPVHINSDNNDENTAKLLQEKNHKESKEVNRDVDGSKVRSNKKKIPESDKAKELIKNVMNNASKAAEIAESISSRQKNRPRLDFPPETATTQQRSVTNDISSPPATINTASTFEKSIISPSSNSIFSVDLDECISNQLGFEFNRSTQKVVADCTNQSSSCLLSISLNGKVTWKDKIPNSRCTCLSGSKQYLVLGTNDGTVFIYATAPSTGFKSGMVIRTQPPVVFGSPIVCIQVFKAEHMLVITANGFFGIYDLHTMKLVHKNSILPALHQMRLSSNSSVYPKLARAQITPSNHFILILSLNRAPGGNLQAFVYSKDLELWHRVADSTYSLSEFYTTLPTGEGILSKLHGAICLGSNGAANAFPSDLGDSDSEYIISRSHCEDRMSCAIALNSDLEFKYWLKMYARRLVKEGEEYSLRFLVDLLHGYDSKKDENSGNEKGCWWLSSASTALNLDKKHLIKLVIEEMGKNRALQRLTSEILMEMESM